MFNKFKKFFYIKNGKVRKEINKQLLVTVISVFITVVSVLGVSFAAFVWGDNSEIEHSIAAGSISLTISSDSDPLGSGLNYPVEDSDINNVEPYTFTITNNGTLAANYTLKLADDVVAIESDGCTGNQIDKSYIYMNLSGGASVPNTQLSALADSVLDTGVLLPGKSKTYDLRLWLGSSTPNSVIGKHYHGKIEMLVSQIEGEEPAGYTDKSGANPPMLAEGMIPVIYDFDKDVWVRADTSKEWYDYNSQWWANAVTTTSTNRATYLSDEHIGKEIPMDEINSMWVWIPRYKYKITTGLGSSSALTNPPQIDVMFENGTSATGVTETAYRAGMSATSNATNTNYYTHPAFRDIDNIEYSSETTSKGAWDEEITGFWAAKFEARESNSIIVIKPDMKSYYAYQDISSAFRASIEMSNGQLNDSTGIVTFDTNENNVYGLNVTANTTNTHMMKNTEWGAVAYLSQSRYGKMGNTSYTGTNKEIFPNNSGTLYESYSQGAYTGRSLGESSRDKNKTAVGAYSYNDISCTTVSQGKCTGSKVTNAGQGASTTGTIYGVYDMSGGYYDRVMGTISPYGVGSSGAFSSLEQKYYDIYNNLSGNSSSTRYESIMGDATWETMYWYSDGSGYVYSTYPWFSRGSNDAKSYSGIFHYYPYTNNLVNGDITGYASRPVLIP